MSPRDARAPSALVVDDSLTVRMDLDEALTAAGFSVDARATLEGAREALRERRADVVVLDVLLPDGDGVEFLAELRAAEETRSLPVMLLTTEAEVGDRIRGLSSGADEYVGKPYDRAWVVARAKELARRRATTPPAGRPSVLVIDDSATFREALREALEGERYEVLTADSGEEGLRVAADRRPAAVVVDGVLPGIDGATVVRRMRLDAALRRTPCILLTASSDARDELSALDAGADAFVQKSDDAGLVLARLAAMLRSAGAPAGLGETASLLSPKKILAVDDSVTYLHAVCARLRDEGYDAIAVESGEAALALLAVQPVDCVLLDLAMPGLSGTETCRRIRATPALHDIPVLMLTAREEREAMIEGINAGADDYIAKSADLDVLAARLRAQIRRRQFEDENRRIREELLRTELQAAEARAARELAATRAELLADLEVKNRELERARDQAERESGSKSRFLASMSHELRTPLNAIIGFSELLEQEIFGPLNPTQRDYVTTVLTSGRHLLNLINDILDLSKVAAGKVELRREWSPLAPVVDTVQSVCRPLASKQGVRLEIAMPDELPRLWIDPVRVKQVLYNLVSNAIKFTPRGGVVKLEVVHDGDRVRMVVSDTGIGIRPEDITRLFKEFEQVEPASGVKPEGTGLGLALSRRLLELHGGTITAESEVGRGSTFTAVIPVAPEGAPAPPEGLGR